MITVSSQLHIPGYAGGKPPDFDYDNLKGEKYYNANVFYRNSKLANMWFTYELQRHLAGTGVTSNAVCPGFVPEAIADGRTSPIDRFMYGQVLARILLRVRWRRLPPRIGSRQPIRSLKGSAASSSQMAKSAARATSPTRTETAASGTRVGSGVVLMSWARRDRVRALCVT